MKKKRKQQKKEGLYLFSQKSNFHLLILMILFLGQFNKFKNIIESQMKFLDNNLYMHVIFVEENSFKNLYQNIWNFARRTKKDQNLYNQSLQKNRMKMLIWVWLKSLSNQFYRRKILVLLTKQLNFNQTRTL